MDPTHESPSRKNPAGGPLKPDSSDAPVKASRFSLDRFDKAPYYWLLLALVSFVLALFETPGITTPLRNWDDSLIGQINQADIHANDDYSIEDASTTETKRLEAEKSVPPVYDYQSKLGNEIQGHIDAAFRQVQGIIHDFILTYLVAPEEDALARKKPASPDAPKPDVEQIRLERLHKVNENLQAYFARVQRDPELSQKLKNLILGAQEEFQRTLRVTLPQEDYLELYGYAFSTELMVALKRTIGDVMTRKIVSDKNLMEKADQPEVTLRVIDDWSPKQAEYPFRDFASVVDFKDVNRSLWRYTTILSELGPRQRDLLLRVAGRLVQPNLTQNRALTVERRREATEAVKTAVIPVKKGEVIIRAGERFEKRHLTVLRGIERQQSNKHPFLTATGYFGFFFFFILGLFAFNQRNVRKFKPEFKDLVMLFTLALLFILLMEGMDALAQALGSRVGAASRDIFFLAVPVAALAAIVRIVLNSESAFPFAVLISIAYGLFTSTPLFMTAYALATGLIAADSVAQCRTRTKMLLTGVRAAAFGFLLLAFHHLLSGSLLSLDFLRASASVLAGGVMTSLLLMAATPAIEFLFSYTTDIKLLELANLNHPLLKNLIVQAPGTYHHSIIIGSMVEAAAESIHANPLLARVAAYYHDVGKTKNPLYFAENLREGANPHESLTPPMSVRILLSHVREGLDLARKNNLGTKIGSIIEQHHGTSLIRYFHHKAQELRRNGAKISDDEREFRYPGPIPQTREAGLVMLADSVEAATRSLEDPTPEKIQIMVQKVINLIFKDGQLNDCELTLKDLNQIAKSFTKILTALHHTRPVYPTNPPPASPSAPAEKMERSPDGRTGSQPAKKGPHPLIELDEEDEEDFKRLDMH